MNWNQVKGNWNQLRGEALTRWGRLCNDELSQVDGNREQLVGLLQEKYGMAKEEAEEETQEFAAEAGSQLDRAKATVAETADQVKAKARQARQTARDSRDYLRDREPSEMFDDLRELISRYPMQSSLVGLGLGYLIGRGFQSFKE